MRKISAIILSLILIMSTLAVLAVPASAEDAKVEIGKVAADYKPAEGAIAVNTAEEFAAMAADGNYYLATDIEINATYETKFTGTFDGCGKTIKTTVSVFKDMSGTFKNATITGKIEKGVLKGKDKSGNDEEYAGAVAAWPTGKAIIDNVYSDVEIVASTVSERYISTAGGIVGYAKDKSEVTITNCVNNANISSRGQTGGIVGYSQGKLCTIKNCVNNGEITASTSYGAGIIGRFGKDASEKTYKVVIENCTNNGDVSSTKDQSAGIIAYIVGIADIKDCVNNGDISNAKGVAAGILGQTSSSEKDKNDKETRISAAVIDGCMNTGKITGITRAAGIVATMGRLAAADGFKYAVSNCINTGEIILNGTVEAYVAGIVAYAWGGSTGNATTGCVNFGNITVKSTAEADTQKNFFVSGILGYYNASNYYVQNNVNLGKITVEGVKNLYLTQIFYNKNTGDAEHISGNMALEVAGEGVVYDHNGDSASATTVFTAEQVASGALAADYNEKVGKKVLYQEVGKDSLPTLTPVVKIDKDGKEVIVNDVVKGEDGKISNPTYVPGGSTPTPTPTPTAKTGDSTVIMMVVFALATVAGLALVFVPKKKEN